MTRQDSSTTMLRAKSGLSEPWKSALAKSLISVDFDSGKGGNS
jgi:hypothetical protein